MFIFWCSVVKRNTMTVLCWAHVTTSHFSHSLCIFHPFRPFPIYFKINTFLVYTMFKILASQFSEIWSASVFRRLKWANVFISFFVKCCANELHEWLNDIFYWRNDDEMRWDAIAWKAQCAKANDRIKSRIDSKQHRITF